MADTAMAQLHAAAPGSDHQLAWAHTLFSAARSEEHVAFMRGLLDGSASVPGLAVDDELRWAIVQELSARGAIDEAAIAAELERDSSAAGQRHAATARALQPTAEAKAEAWRLAMEDDTLPNAMREAVIRGFAHATQGELIAGYAPRYFAEVAGAWERFTSELAQTVVIGLFPSWTSTISQQTLDDADAFLGDTQRPGALRRLVSEGRADVARALRARAADRAGG
jgi:aminopeptidase N